MRNSADMLASFLRMTSSVTTKARGDSEETKTVANASAALKKRQ